MVPLSRKRDKERKRLERAKSRLDKHLYPPTATIGVQPKLPNDYEIVIATPFFELDADGNPIYED